MGAGAAVEVNTDDLKRKLRRLMDSLDNPEQLMKVLGAFTLRWVHDNFNTEGGKVGGWKKLAPSTIARRRRGSGRILQDRGIMRASFAWQATRMESRTGSPDLKSIFHDRGGRGGRPPQRRILPTEPEALAYAVPIADRFLGRQIKKSGLK